MSKKSINIAILGCGTVGTGLVQLLETHKHINIKAIAVRDKNKKRNLNLDPAIFTENIDSVLENPEIDIIVELMGGVEKTKTILTKALKNGKHIVSANKDLMALEGEDLFQVASEQGKTILYEAAVAGGIPIVSNLKQSLQGNKIKKLYGIINGTTNFILDSMKKENMSFDDALSKAQELGFAESDPTNDVDGHDAAYKISILGSIISGKQVNVNEVFREGIRKISQEDIQSAEKRGYKIKLLGLIHNNGDELDIRVHPVFVPLEHDLASVNMEFNAVTIDGSALGELTLIGKGAGSLPTASAVLGDLLMLSSNIDSIHPDFKTQAYPERAKIKKFEDIESAFYVRISMTDKAGVLKGLGDITAKNNASIKFIDQYDVHDNVALADFMLSPVSEKNMQNILKELEKMPNINETQSVIRVLS